MKKFIIVFSNYSAQIILIKSNKVLDRLFVEFFQNPTGFRCRTDYCFIQPRRTVIAALRQWCAPPGVNFLKMP